MYKAVLVLRSSGRVGSCHSLFSGETKACCSASFHQQGT